MKYEICYIDKTGKNFPQELETFSEFQEFKDKYLQLYSKPLDFLIQGVSVYRTSRDELHGVVFINKETNSILMYKSTEDGIENLMSLALGTHLEVLDSSLYYDC